MTPVVKTVNLTKRYGTLVALSNLNLEIAPGDCFGFIGPNGAGKTTTMKILGTLLQPTWGRSADLRLRRRVSVAPDSSADWIRAGLFWRV